MNVRYGILGVASLLTLFASPAFATYGTVKVDCGESCFDVVVGAVCDAYVQHARPVSIACDDTATPGYGRQKPCGNGIYCTSYGTLQQSDPVGAYCAPGPGNDAIVTCVYPPPETLDADGEPVEDSDPAPGDKVPSDSSPPPPPTDDAE
jgi:hypothetical protein